MKTYFDIQWLIHLVWENDKILQYCIFNKCCYLQLVTTFL